MTTEERKEPSTEKSNAKFEKELLNWAKTYIKDHPIANKKQRTLGAVK